MYDKIDFDVLNVDMSTVQHIRDTINIGYRPQHETLTYFTGGYKGLRITYIARECKISVVGSLPKYFWGNNLFYFNKKELKECMSRLAGELYINLGTTIVNSIEFAENFDMQQPPCEYLKLFDRLSGQGHKLAKYYNSTDMTVESVLYYTATGGQVFRAYDKLQEMRDKGEEIKDWYDLPFKNTLRLEVGLQNRQAIARYFEKPLSVVDLAKYDVYEKFRKILYDSYMKIEKTGRHIFFDKEKNYTQKDTLNIFCEALRQSNPDLYSMGMTILKGNGLISDLEMKRIRARDKQNGSDYSFSDWNDLIEELNMRMYNGCLRKTR